MTSHQPGVIFVEERAFDNCVARTDCGVQQARNNIGYEVFSCCKSLPSARIAEALVFEKLRGADGVKFGSKLKSIEEEAFIYNESLERDYHPVERRLGLLMR